MDRLHTIGCVLGAVFLTGCIATEPLPTGRMSIDLRGGVVLHLVRIDPGEFTMGSRDDAEQSPPHRVRIPRAFYMGTTEVTNAQFRRYRADFDSNERRGGANLAYQRYIRSLYPKLNGDDQPVVYVGWAEARAFTQWLSEQSGMTARLPSEAEWEYACRAGTTGRYSWGDDRANAHRFANTNDPITAKEYRLGGPFPHDDGYRATAPVGSFEPNAFGLYDMHGNVAEWIADVWHDDYVGAPSDGSAWTDARDKRRRVTRGGSFESSPSGRHYFDCASAARSWNYAGNHNFGTGFRIVVEIASTSQAPSRLFGPSSASPVNPRKEP